MRKQIQLALGILSLTLSAPLYAQDGAEEVKTTRVSGGENPQIEAVDIPTAEILDPVTTLNRLGNAGGRSYSASAERVSANSRYVS